MDTNSKPLYIPWKEEVFQADVFVRGMTWLQRHLYRALLCASFFHGTRPYLPNDDDVLWVLAGAESLEMWQQNKTTILRRFTVCEHNPNLLENKRVTADWNRLLDSRNDSANQGRVGGLKSAEVRREKYGTAQPTVLIPEGASKGASEVFGEKTPNTEAREVKVSKDKISEEKSSEEPSVSAPSSSRADWKNIALRHKRQFGIKASVKFKDKYFAACEQYGEEVVLQCFDAWAPGAKDWVGSHAVDHPLYAFFKQLPEEAEDTLEVDAAEKEEKEQQEEQQKIAEQTLAESITRQDAAFNERMSTHPVVNEVSIEDMLSGA